jgi:hypothetical protein
MKFAATHADQPLPLCPHGIPLIPAEPQRAKRAKAEADRTDPMN